jgi:hypothetical protein
VTSGKISRNDRAKNVMLANFPFIKESVQRDVTGVEIGLKKCILKSYLTGKISFSNIKARNQAGFSILKTIKMKVLDEFTNPASNGLRTFNLKKQ